MTHPKHNAKHPNISVTGHDGDAGTRPIGPDQFKEQGWRGQLRRVERWHRRAGYVLDPYRRIPEDEIVDFLYAFFQSAYHMRDWLEKSGGSSKEALDELMESSRCLKLCRDVCNGSKHFALKPQRSNDVARIGLMREYVPPPPGGHAGRTRPSLLAFQNHAGQVEFRRIDELIDECLTTWQKFCGQAQS
jgi:hypothetical protein